MTPFQIADIDPSELELNINDLLAKWEKGDATIRSMMPEVTRRGDALSAIKQVVYSEHCGVTYWLNDTYQVAVRPLDNDAVHLSIKRLDRQPIHDWGELQQIKNELVGPECEGCELYPSESRKVDTANQFHIWAIKDPAFRFPFGFTTRAVSDTTTVGQSAQRKL